MLTFNENNNNKPVIDLFHKDDLNKNHKFKKDAQPYKTLYLNTDSNNDKLTINELSPYIPFPHINPNLRFSCFINGSSGSAKTTTACNLIFLLLKAIPNLRILFFTGIINGDDELIKYFHYLFKGEFKNRLIMFTPKSFSQIKQFNQNSKSKLSIPLTVDEINQIQLKYSKLQNNNDTDILCVFDDIENINNAIVKKLLLNLESDILLTGRCHNRSGGIGHIHCISISHGVTAVNSRKRLLLLETQWNIFNLKCHSDNHISNLLKIKYGYSDEETEKVIEMKHSSGAYLITFFSSSYPYIIFNDRSIMVS